MGTGLNPGLLHRRQYRGVRDTNVAVHRQGHENLACPIASSKANLLRTRT